MPKTLRNFLLEGGVKGKKFIDPTYLKKEVCIYEVTSININGGRYEPPFGVVEGVIVKDSIRIHYINALDNCLAHKEAE